MPSTSWPAGGVAVTAFSPATSSGLSASRPGSRAVMVSCSASGGIQGRFGADLPRLRAAAVVAVTIRSRSVSACARAGPEPVSGATAAAVKGRTCTVSPSSYTSSRAPTQATCTSSRVPWPVRRIHARPGVRRDRVAASGASMTSVESSGEATRSAIRRSVLALIWGVTTPAGRWVARIMCIPSERPRWAMETMPSTNSGTSASSAANSSTQISMLGGAISGCVRSRSMRSLAP